MKTHIPLELIVHERLLNLALCAHHERAVLMDLLFKRFAGDEDEPSPPRRRRRLEPDAGLAFVVGQDGRVILLDRFGRGERISDQSLSLEGVDLSSL